MPPDKLCVILLLPVCVLTLLLENNDPEYIIKLIQRIVTISVESMKIKNSLPPIEEIN